MDDTAIDLFEVLKQTRMESGGITIDFVARIINRAWEKEEVELLIERLNVLV